MSQVTLPLLSPGMAGATATVDVVRLALAYLNGGNSQGNATPAPTAGRLLAGQILPGQGTAVPGTTVPGASGQASLQQDAVLAQGTLAKRGAGGSTDLLSRNLSMPPTTIKAPAGSAQPDARPTARDVIVAGRSHHAALVMRSHGAIAGLLRADAGLQIADSVLRKIDDRLARMQDLVRRAEAGPPTAQARAPLDLPFQKIKQEVVALLPPATSSGGGAPPLPTDALMTAVVRIFPAGDSVRLAQDINSPAVTLQRKIPVILQALAQTGLSTQSQVVEADAVLNVVRGNGHEVRNNIAGQRDVIGNLLSQELSRRIGISSPPVVRTASALPPGAQLSSAVASALLVQPVQVPGAMNAAIGGANGLSPVSGSDGQSVRPALIESPAMLVTQPNRAEIVALLSPATGSLDEPGVTGPQSIMPMADRPLPLPPPVSGMAAELLFGLVPGWRARPRDGLTRPKRPSEPRKNRHPRRKGDDSYA